MSPFGDHFRLDLGWWVCPPGAAIASSESPSVTQSAELCSAGKSLLYENAS